MKTTINRVELKQLIMDSENSIVKVVSVFLEKNKLFQSQVKVDE